MTGEELALASIEYRKLHDLTAWQLAAKVGCSGGAIIRLEETGALPKNPARDKLIAFLNGGPAPAPEQNVPAPPPPPPPPKWKQLSRALHRVEEGEIKVDHELLCRLLDLPEGQGQTDFETILMSDNKRVSLPLVIKFKVYTDDGDSEAPAAE